MSFKADTISGDCWYRNCRFSGLERILEICSAFENYFFLLANFLEWYTYSWLTVFQACYWLWRRSVVSLLQAYPERYFHLLCHCDLEKQVSDKVERWHGVQQCSLTNIVDHFTHFRALFRGNKVSKTKHIILTATCWSIWLVRNNLIFKGEEPSVDFIVNHIKCNSLSWFIYGAGSLSDYSVSSWWHNVLLCINNL